MKQEFSAGGIVVCTAYSHWYVLCIRDINNQLTFPKGLIGKFESKREAATREVSEETGILPVTFLSALQSVSYTFSRNTEDINKTISYFLYSVPQMLQPKPQTEEGITEALWILIEEAKSRIGYPRTNIPLLDEVMKFVNHTV